MRIYMDLICLLSISISMECLAEFKVYSPIVHKGGFAFEYSGHTTLDNSNDADGIREHVFELEKGITDWWRASLWGRLRKPAEGALEFDVVTWENIV